MNKKFVNVLILGFGFMFLFTAFQTMGNISKIVLVSVDKDKGTDFTGDGYISLAIVYTTFSIGNWLAPSFLSLTGPRTAMVVGGVIYCAYISVYLWPQIWLLYIMSGILGLGAAVTWTGQGTFLSLNSEPKTISRNSGIFWAMLQMSMFFGNLFVYFQFQVEEINSETRDLVIGVLTAVAVLGIIFLAALRPVENNSNNQDRELQNGKNAFRNAVDAFKSAWALFKTKDMLLLSCTFFYTGLELSFFSGVYGPSIGFTLKIAETPKQLIGLVGICIGAGEVIGGGLFGLLGAKTTKLGRDPIVIMGFILHAVTFFLVFLNLPNNAPFDDTEDIGYLDPPLAWLALVGAFTLGLGDACFNTQIYSMLGGVFARQSVEAFALFKFTQSVAAAISFFYSPHVGLHIQLPILLVFSIIGTGCFCVVEWANKRRLKDSKNDDTDSVDKIEARVRADDVSSTNS